MNSNPYYADSSAQFQTRVNTVLIGLAPVDIGTLEPASAQSEGSVAIGAHAGIYGQSDGSVAIGERAGHTGQSESAIALGAQAGQTQQSTEAVALGNGAGSLLQQPQAVAIGAGAGNALQATGAVALGANAGQTQQGANSVAVGAVGQGAFAGSVVLNATGNALNVSGSDRLLIAPLRDALTGDQLMTYSSSELVRTTTLNFNPTINGNLRTGRLTRTPSFRSISAPPFPNESTNLENTILAWPTGDQWSNAGVVGSNGKIYFSPNSNGSVLVVDPTTNGVSYINAILQGAGKWGGNILAPNGKIYGVAENSPRIYELDPATENLSLVVTSGSSLSGNGKGAGGVLHSDGKIYQVPASQSNVTIFDPVTKVVDRTFMQGLGGVGSGGYQNGTLGADGKIYCIPRNATSVLILDPISPVTTLTGSVGTTAYNNSNRNLTCTGALFNSELTFGDNILITTSTATYTGYVQTVTNDTTVVLLYALGVNISTGVTNLQKTRRADFTSIQGLVGSDKWFGGSLASDGKIYATPFSNASSVLVIDPASPVTSIAGITPTILSNSTYNNSTLRLTCPGASFLSTVSRGDNIIIRNQTSPRLATNTTYTGYVDYVVDNENLVFLYALGTTLLSSANTIDSIQKTRRADVTSITGLTTTSNKWWGSALHPDGKIYCTPFSNSNVLIIDPSSPLSTIPGVVPANTSYNNTTQTLTCTGATFTTTVSRGDNIILTTSTTNSYTGYVDAVLDNEKLRFVFALGTLAGTINSVQKTRKADVTTLTGISDPTFASFKWAGCMCAPNGKIYASPYLASSVLMVDPSSPVTSIAGITPTILSNSTYTNATRTLTCPGASFLSSLTQGDNLLIQVSTTTYTGYVNRITDDANVVLWFALGADLGASTILSLQKTRRVDSFSLFASVGGSAFSGGVLSPNDGKIYSVPFTASSMLIIDPNTDTGDLSTIKDLGGFPFQSTNSSMWSGNVVGRDRKIYGIPASSTRVLIVDTTSPVTTLSGNFATASYTRITQALVCPGALFLSELSRGDNVLITTTTDSYTGYVQYVASNTTVVFIWNIIRFLDLVPGTITNLRKTRKADVLSIQGLVGTLKWAGGVLAPNGKIYGIPRDSTSILIIDPSSPVTALTGNVLGAVYTDISPAQTLICPGALFLTELTIGDNVLITTVTGDYTGYVQSVTNNTTVVLVYALGLDLASGTITNLRKTRKADVTTLTNFLGATGTSKWQGGALGSNGKIYTIPSSSTRVLEIDPLTNLVRSIATDLTGTTKWYGGVLAPDGKIYGMPASSTSVLIIDPSSPTTTLTGNFSGATYTNSSRTLVVPSALFTTQLSMGDNLILSTTVSGYTQVTGYVQSITNATTLVVFYAFGVNFGANDITNIQKTRTADITRIQGLATTASKWAGGTLGLDNEIYGIPYAFAGALIINPTSPVVTLTGTPSSAVYTNSNLTLTCTGALFLTELVAGDNVIITTSTTSFTGYVSSVTNNTTVVFLYALGTNITATTITNLQKTRRADVTTVTTTGTVGNRSDKYIGGVLAPSGKIYSAGYGNTGCLIINTNVPSNPNSWALEPYFNKF